MIHASTEPCGIFGSPQHAWSVPHLSCSLVDRDPYFTSPTQHVRKPTMAQLLRSNCGANPCATLHKPEFRSNVRNFGSHTFERLRCPPPKKTLPHWSDICPRIPAPALPAEQQLPDQLSRPDRRAEEGGGSHRSSAINRFFWMRGGGGAQRGGGAE